MSTRFFCSLSSQQRREQIFGTAPHVTSWLLVEHPGPWSSKSFPDDLLPAPVSAHIDRIARAFGAGKRLIIRRHHRRDEEFRVFMAVTEEDACAISYFSFRNIDEFLACSAEEAIARAQLWTRPLYLVCTHGRHDKCCAKYGFPAYCALREMAPEDAWECSHVGGDRFAANILCFPQGIYYGHVPPEAIWDLVAEHRQGRMMLEYFRGRCAYKRIAQVGEYFVRDESGLRGIADLVLLGSRRVGPRQWSVEFASRSFNGGYEVEFLRGADVQHCLLTCGSNEPAAIAQYEFVRYSVIPGLRR